MKNISTDAVRDLMAAVIQQAVDDIRKPKPIYELKGKPKKGERYDDFVARRIAGHRNHVSQWKATKEQAQGWIDNDRSDHLFSFPSLCDHLDINPDAARRRLKA